ncbi:hypothetical protein [Amycolatopsis sp. NPDC051128]|uniref:hypothetical protein n=1 Tax=Amycolatopsis sp. NPDC051128 TaxID=3155412 RepID=UPI0034246E76
MVAFRSVGYGVVGPVSVVLAEGAPAELEPPPGVVGSVGEVVGVVGVVVTGGLVEVGVVGFGGDVVAGGGLPPVSPRGGGVEERGTTVVVVLPSGLTDTTVVGVLGDVGAEVVGSPPTVEGPVEDGVFDSVRTPAGTVPWPPGPPVPPAVPAGTGPASPATAANAVETTSPATPSTTYPVRFGLLLRGGAVSILVTRELESDPSGRGIQAPWEMGESRFEVVNLGHCVVIGHRARGGGATSAGRLSPPREHSPR